MRTIVPSLVAVLLVLCACGTERAEEAEPVTEPSAGLVQGALDLPGGLSLGMEGRSARPSLTEGCLRDHYAERPSERFLRLSCVVAESPYVTRLRLAFFEDDAAPARLAYYITETSVPESALEMLWGHLRDEAERELGAPDLAHSERQLAWSGVGRDGEPTLYELSARPDPVQRDHVLVQRAWRHRTLVARLGLPR